MSTISLSSFFFQTIFLSSLQFISSIFYLGDFVNYFLIFLFLYIFLLKFMIFVLTMFFVLLLLCLYYFNNSIMIHQKIFSFFLHLLISVPITPRVFASLNKLDPNYAHLGSSILFQWQQIDLILYMFNIYNIYIYIHTHYNQRTKLILRDAIFFPTQAKIGIQ